MINKLLIMENHSSQNQKCRKFCCNFLGHRIFLIYFIHNTAAALAIFLLINHLIILASYLNFVYINSCAHLNKSVLYWTQVCQLLRYSS
jgi:hypothetical protein